VAFQQGLDLKYSPLGAVAQHSIEYSALRGWMRESAKDRSHRVPAD
jgi:hypothetical protein